MSTPTPLRHAPLPLSQDCRGVWVIRERPMTGRLVYSDPSAVVLDPFAGSATTLSVAKRLGRRSIGIELSAAYCRPMRR